MGDNLEHESIGRSNRGMKVAVLMSTYNGEKYLREQIDSIISQSVEIDLDIWVRDDGSTDSTQKILEEYAQLGKIQWYSGENLRAASSFIDLIRQCKGYDYYAFSDQDDYWKPNKVQKAVDVLSKIGTSIPALYCANAELVGSNLEPLGRNVYVSMPRIDFETLCCAGGLLGCTMVFNSTLAKIIQNAPMPEKIVMHDFYVALLCSVLGGSIIYDSDACMKYRQHGNNVIGVKKGSIVGRVKEILKKAEIGIAEQANTIVNNYGSIIPQGNITWIIQISNYKKSFYNQVALAISKNTKYMNKNTSLRIRLSILIGNR